MPPSLFETVNRLGTTWAGVMAAVAIQAVALAALALLASRLLRRTSPAVRHALWLVVAAKLLLMPFWTWSVTRPSFWARYESPVLASIAEERGFALGALPAGDSSRAAGRIRRPRGANRTGLGEASACELAALLALLSDDHLDGGDGVDGGANCTDARRPEQSLAPRRDAR